LDFGIAKLTAMEGSLAQTAGATSSGGILGTPNYMAPEQIFGDRDLDHRVDVWALGIILYRCLTGILPTEAENVGQVLKLIVTRAIWPLTQAAPDLPPDVTELVDSMLAKDRSKRPRHLREVEDVLRRHVDSALPARPRDEPLIPSTERAIAEPEH